MLSKKELSDAVRVLSMDAVEKANSGHPGMPMGMADIAEVLWNDFLVHNPNNPDWINRDRFILSNGHGSMLLYSLLHLTGYDLSIEDLKNFRQLGSRTPGHPEVGHTPGVETTTGPLGQGLANAVGMAMAERALASEFNKDFNIIDHYTYCFVGDGCLMEGISHEVSSFAGTHGLGKLIVFWDQNGISIDGEIDKWFSENTPLRFESYNWQVIADVDGHDHSAIKEAIINAKSNMQQPTLICCRTKIGFGSPNKSGKASSHGSPLGAEEIKATKENLNWQYPEFHIPDEIYKAWDAKEKGSKAEKDWQDIWHVYSEKEPELSSELLRRLKGDLPLDLESKAIESSIGRSIDVATRKASQDTLNDLTALLPELIGGSADLTGSNLTMAKYSKIVDPSSGEGNYIYYGVREFGMAAIMNGIALYGGFIPYGGTFLVFSDYARNAIRLSALMRQRVIYVLTHDSIGLGEDGPTHQPIEHLSTLRSIPNNEVWRPCDALETTVAWLSAVSSESNPSCLALSRQKLPCINKDDSKIEDIFRGAYIVKDFGADLHAVIIATGSEVSLAMLAAEKLEKEGINTRVLSMPCAEAFARQSKKYQDKVLLRANDVPRIAIEAGSSSYWYRWVGLDGLIIGLDDYGVSAPGDIAYKAMGLTEQDVTNKIRAYVADEVSVA